MSYTIREIHIWKCDIPDCKEQITGATGDYAYGKGWETDSFFGVEVFLCPFHTKELKGFLFDDGKD